jgi:hypothetical protein
MGAIERVEGQAEPGPHRAHHPVRHDPHDGDQQSNEKVLKTVLHADP